MILHVIEWQKSVCLCFYELKNISAWKWDLFHWTLTKCRMQESGERWIIGVSSEVATLHLQAAHSNFFLLLVLVFIFFASESSETYSLQAMFSVESSAVQLFYYYYYFTFLFLLDRSYVERWHKLWGKGIRKWARFKLAGLHEHHNLNIW